VHGLSIEKAGNAGHGLGRDNPIRRDDDSINFLQSRMQMLVAPHE
jgi:hypothetical protein